MPTECEYHELNADPIFKSIQSRGRLWTDSEFRELAAEDKAVLIPGVPERSLFEVCSVDYSNL